jgi:hypothetical protein
MDRFATISFSSPLWREEKVFHASWRKRPFPRYSVTIQPNFSGMPGRS